MQNPQYEILETSTCYAGFFHILRYRLRHRLFKGGWSRVLTRELFERGHAAAVLPYDAETDQVVLTEQFRIGALQASGGPWLLEIVAGMMETGETPEAVVRREAVEEIGCEVGDLISICDYYVSPGGASERIHLFCGRVDAAQAGGVHGLADEGEDIRVTVMPADDAIAHMQTGRIISAAPIIALQWLMMHRASVREAWRQAC